MLFDLPLFASYICFFMFAFLFLLFLCRLKENGVILSPGTLVIPCYNTFRLRGHGEQNHCEGVCRKGQRIDSFDHFTHVFAIETICLDF